MTVSTSGDRGPAWAHDGLYFQDLEGTVVFVPLSGSSGIAENAAPRRVMSVPWANDTGAPWGVTRDGQSFVVLRDVQPPTGSLDLVLDWFGELRRLVDSSPR